MCLVTQLWITTDGKFRIHPTPVVVFYDEIVNLIGGLTLLSSRKDVFLLHSIKNRKQINNANYFEEYKCLDDTTLERSSQFKKAIMNALIFLILLLKLFDSTIINAGKTKNRKIYE